MRHFTEKLIYKLLDTGTELHRFSLSIDDFISKNIETIKKVMSETEVDISDFLSLYDQKIYDINSKQNDIKYMKSLDFKGVYCIKNQTKRKYYIDIGDNVFRKVDRHFKGYGNQEIFTDFKNKNNFSVIFWKNDSRYDDINDYKKDVKAKMHNELDGYVYYISFPKTEYKFSNIENTKENTEYDYSVEQISEHQLKELKKKRRKAFWFNKKRIALDVSISELVGMKYEDVYKLLFNNGFINITSEFIKDIYIDSPHEPGDVEKIYISGRHTGNYGEMIPYDEKIKIIYHLKRELFFPYSSKRVRNKNSQNLLIKLRNIGFSNINLIPINDLRIGWIVKDRAIDRVLLNGQDNYKKNVAIEYDAKIDIYYHTFK